MPLSYPEVGASRGEAPAGYPVNHHRTRLGHGRAVYERACDAVRQWEMYAPAWTTLCWPHAPVRTGTTVAVLVRHFGFWSLNPARIVYVLEESDPVERYGFGFGTLPGHQERGEERFTVEFHPADGSVWYEIYSFASGRGWIVRLAYPLMRYVQWRFGRDSTAAMRAAVRAGGA